MSKYIIKNCPAILKMSKVCDDYRTTRDNPQLCKDCTDCVLKQIVEKCRNVECDCIVDKNKCGAMDNMPVCCDLWRRKDILGLLDIQEVE